MQLNSLLAAGCGIMVFGVAALDYAVKPLPVPKPRKLPVASFPARLGNWQGGAIAPVDPDIQARLPTSAIMDRVYTAGTEQAADVMLVTASDNMDIHNPKDCFPSQGWRLTNSHTVTIQGQPVTVMDAQLDAQKLKVLYWTTGVFMPPPPRSALEREALALREKIVPRHEFVSLFVRLTVPQNPHAEEEVTQLAGQVLPPVRSMLQSAKKPGEQISALPSFALPTDLKKAYQDRKESIRSDARTLCC